MLNIKNLGHKICIIGCSSSGKSTLSHHLSVKLGLPVTYLDLLAHEHGTNWHRKSDLELIQRHRKVLERDAWIIDGNYSVCMQERLMGASSVIWLDYSVIACGFRYLWRCFIGDDSRKGKLPGSKKEFSIWLLKHILFAYPKKRLSYQALIDGAGVPSLKINSMRQLNHIMREWGLC